MRLSLPVARRPLRGRAETPGDKSIAHRAALFAALAEGDSRVANFPDSGVTRAMLGALKSLGIESSLENGTLRVRGNGYRPFPNSGAVAYCGNSATTMRLLAGAVAGTGSAATLDGSAGLRRRPMDRIVEPLRAMGADIDCAAGSAADGRGILCAPVSFRPSRLHGIDYALPVASAQVQSCLQIAALGASGESHFSAPGPVRDHTVRMLRAMGAPDMPLKPLDCRLPGDISSAAFLLAAAAIVPGSRIEIANAGVNPTRTGILDVLSAMGAKLSLSNRRDEGGEPVADIALEAAPLKGVSIGGDLVVRAIDEIPAIAAVAAFADGVTEIRDAGELRYKESDRIAALAAQLGALGADVTEFPDGLAIRGGTVGGGLASAGGDHRLAMAMAVCSLRAPVEVDGAEIVNESFPGFAAVLSSLCD